MIRLNNCVIHEQHITHMVLTNETEEEPQSLLIYLVNSHQVKITDNAKEFFIKLGGEPEEPESASND